MDILFSQVESTAWLVVLLGSLAFMFLLLSSVMFYYRRRKATSCGTSAGYLTAAVTDMEHYQAKTPDGCRCREMQHVVLSS